MLLRIKEWRQRFGLTQAQVAGQCGLSREMISALETGRYPATLPQLEKVAAALDLRVTDLLDERPAPCVGCPGAPAEDPAPGPRRPTCLRLARLSTVLSAALGLW